MQPQFQLNYSTQCSTLALLNCSKRWFHLTNLLHELCYNWTGYFIYVLKLSSHLPWVDG